MSPALVGRVLDTWERGVDLDVQERASLALGLVGDVRDPSILTFHERDLALVDVRRSLFGDGFDGVVCCPACGEVFDIRLDLAALDRSPPAAEPVRVEVDGYAAQVRPPIAADVSPVTIAAPAEYAEALFVRCVLEATHHGAPIAADRLPAAVRAAAASALSAQGMEGPYADLTCGDCGRDWRAPIDIARGLLDDLDDWARRLLYDIHSLASAYHWSERDIIALPMRRRLFYLEAIG